MDIVFVTSEAVPYAKTGGLADVAGALPRALARHGHRVTLILPAYRSCPGGALPRPDDRPLQARIGSLDVGGFLREIPSPMPNLRVLFVGNPQFFHRSGLYQNERSADYDDNAERFVYLCRAAFESLDLLDIPVDCWHAHDWQAGLVPAYLKEIFRTQPRFRDSACVFTIHNIAFQGLFEGNKWPLLGLDRSLFDVDGLEFYQKISLLKAGIVHADIISTVSKTYAKEIQGRLYGAGLEGVLSDRADRLVGIVNGIDHDAWNPTTDGALARGYDVDTWCEGKAACRRQLREAVGLPDVDDATVFGVVGRLTRQKGFDLLAEVADEVLANHVQLVVLGKGEPKLEGQYRRLQQRYPRQMAVQVDFNDRLARQIYAGADAFLMPSRFEPCGLSQLYSLRYGTVPIVRAVGGLADTVVDATPRNLAEGTADGFSFIHYTPEALLTAIRRALALHADRPAWSRLVRRGMTRDWSWESQAKEYVNVYQRAIDRVRRGEPSHAAS